MTHGYHCLDVEGELFTGPNDPSVYEWMAGLLGWTGVSVLRATEHRQTKMFDR